MNFPNLKNASVIAFDTETYDPTLLTLGPGVRRGGFIAGVSVAADDKDNSPLLRAYFPIAHKQGDNLDKKKVFAWLNTILKLPVPKVGMNLLYDLDYLAEAGVTAVGPFYDVANAEFLIDETRLKYNLASIGAWHGEGGKDEEELLEWIKKNVDKKQPKANIWRAPVDIVAPYAIGDVDLPLRVFRKQKVWLKKLGLEELFELESRLIPLLLAMRRRGVRVDIKAAKVLHRSLGQDQAASIKAIADITGVVMAPSGMVKPEVLAVLSHCRINGKPLVIPKTPKGAPSITAPWLEQQEDDGGICDLIRHIRHMDKMRGTFLQAYIIDGNVKGRVHCQFNQLKPVTGRFSSSKPNLQNIPQRTEDGKKIRKAFVPEVGQLWWKLDWSQIEYRLLSHDAADLDLDGAAEIARRYREDPTLDFHDMIAVDIWGEGYDKGLRTRAKTINFGIAYGEGRKKLARDLGMTREEADAFLANYHQRVPFMKGLSDHCKNEANRLGSLRTLLNRRRCFNMFEKGNDDWARTQSYFSLDPNKSPGRPSGTQRAGTYAALNARTQGSAADIMKLAMVNAWEAGIFDDDALGPPHLTVHDELDGSFDPRDKKHVAALIKLKWIMEHPTDLRGNLIVLNVPLRADGAVGKTWGSMDEKKFPRR